MTSRRTFLKQTAATGSAVAFAPSVSFADELPFPKGKAEHCIMIWLGGGACQLGSRRCLFLDLALGAEDHLAVALELLGEQNLPGNRAA